MTKKNIMQKVVDWCCSKAQDCSDCEFVNDLSCIRKLKEKFRKEEENGESTE